MCVIINPCVSNKSWTSAVTSDAFLQCMNKETKTDLLFQDEDNLVVVPEHVLEVDDLGGVVAHGQHGDLVQDLHGAVDAAADARRVLGRVLDAGLAVRALADCSEQATRKKKKKR